MEKSIFEMITDYAVNEGLSRVLQQSDEYGRIQKKMNDATSEFEALCLPKEQRLIIDRLLTSYNESGAYYGKMTYQQGLCFVAGGDRPDQEWKGRKSCVMCNNKILSKKTEDDYHG